MALNPAPKRMNLITRCFMLKFFLCTKFVCCTVLIRHRGETEAACAQKTAMRMIFSAPLNAWKPASLAFSVVRKFFARHLVLWTNGLRKAWDAKSGKICSCIQGTSIPAPIQVFLSLSENIGEGAQRDSVMKLKNVNNDYESQLKSRSGRHVKQHLWILRISEKRDATELLMSFCQKERRTRLKKLSRQEPNAKHRAFVWCSFGFKIVSSSESCTRRRQHTNKCAAGFMLVFWRQGLFKPESLLMTKASIRTKSIFLWKGKKEGSPLFLNGSSRDFQSHRDWLRPQKFINKFNQIVF